MHTMRIESLTVYCSYNGLPSSTSINYKQKFKTRFMHFILLNQIVAALFC